MSQGAKRKRPSGVLKPRKRPGTTRNEKKSVQRGPSVSGDQLPWKEVTVSRHLDDAEGFFGLEELSDVEVVTDDTGKGLVFKPSLKLNDRNGTGEVTNEPEEWAGFDEQVAPSQHADAPSDMKEKNNSRATNINRTTDVDRGSDDNLLEDVRFDMLDGEAPEPETDMSAWKELDLSSQMLYALSALKFATPTQIQASAIPSITAGNDVIGKAVTGSGKTLAFGIPIIESSLEAQKSGSGQPTALILAPTRELAHQISKHLVAVCKGLDTSPRVVTVTGGLSILKQQRQLEKFDIIVATPGRLWEVVSESNDFLERLKKIRFLVIDEADRLLSEGHFQEVEDILDALDRKTVDEEDGVEQEEEPENKRQTLVFSATFHKGLQQKLATKSKKRTDKDKNLLSDKQSLEYLIQKLPFQEDQRPAFIDANPESQMAENLSETILECKAMEKDLYLYGLLLQDQNNKMKSRQLERTTDGKKGIARILVFTNSVSAVKRLVPLLQSLEMSSTLVSPLHSNMPQKSRMRSLERFSGTEATDGKHKTTVLVATDVAARGLDIQGITTIVHYHVPRTADAYVHRSGRTARSNKSGDSILLCSPDETASVTKLIAKVHSATNTKSLKDISKVINRTYLQGGLLQQLKLRIELAQKLIDSNQSTEKVKSEGNWLRAAAEDLGVDYDSEEFENAGRQGHRGRGSGKARKQKKEAEQENRQIKVAEWKARLKEDLGKRVDLGDGLGRNSKYLAGGAYDIDKLLAERSQQ